MLSVRNEIFHLIFLIKTWISLLQIRNMSSHIGIPDVTYWEHVNQMQKFHTQQLLLAHICYSLQGQIKLHCIERNQRD